LERERIVGRVRVWGMKGERERDIYFLFCILYGQLLGSCAWAGEGWSRGQKGLRKWGIRETFLREGDMEK
jgi:hypothetical protein